ncbi:MAG: DUF4231 domain-containing protein [Chloroflexi bacterium]|nr:MAG: DUF4231 domain-containing protein [Chloroflexota bacterium]
MGDKPRLPRREYDLPKKPATDDWVKVEKRLEQWRMRSQRNRAFHYEASRSSQRYHYALGIPTVGLSTMVATLGFLSLSGTVSFWINALVAGLGSLAAILAALQTFLNFGSRAEAHRKAGVRYGNITRDIEATLATPRHQRGAIEQIVNRFVERMNSAASEAPPLAEKTLAKTMEDVLSEEEMENPWESDSYRPSRHAAE